jgi:predicted transcriptional regulator
MKKIFFMCVAVLFLFSTAVLAGELAVGTKASDWSFKDSDKKEFTMESWAGKVLMINYVDPDKSDLNEPFTDAMKKAKDDGRLTDADYKGMGIADCAATWKPDFAIRLIAGKKAKKYKTVILFDYDAVLRKAWGLKKDTSNIIILDKDRVCRAIVRGKVPDDQAEKLIQLCVDLQSK